MDGYFAEVKGIEEFAARLTAVERTQVPFTVVLGLTKLAQRGEKAVESELPSRFTLRRPDWAYSGVRAVPATKNTYYSAVRDINRYMELQETGGEKLPFKNKVAVPLSGARPTKTALIRAEDRPHAVLFGGPHQASWKRHKGGVFTKYTSGFIRGNILYRVVQTVQGGTRGKRRKHGSGPLLPGGDFSVPGPSFGRQKNRIVPMYALVPRANVPSRYHFVDTVRTVVEQYWQTDFREAWQRAIATMKR
jgi:hypothetical protein